jgi:hypothetical protein
MALHDSLSTVGAGSSNWSDIQRDSVLAAAYKILYSKALHYDIWGDSTARTLTAFALTVTLAENGLEGDTNWVNHRANVTAWMDSLLYGRLRTDTTFQRNVREAVTAATTTLALQSTLTAVQSKLDSTQDSIYALIDSMQLLDEKYTALRDSINRIRDTVNTIDEKYVDLADDSSGGGGMASLPDSLWDKIAMLALKPAYWTHDDTVTYQGALAQVDISALAETLLARGIISSGSGPYACTLFTYETADTSAIGGAHILILSLSGGIPAGNAYTLSDGGFIFGLNTGTYQVIKQRDGYSWSKSIDTITIAGAGETDTIWGTSQVPGLPPASMCMINLNVVSANGDTLKPTFFKWTIVKNDSNHTSYGTTPLVVGTGLSAISIAKTGEVKSNSSNFQIPLYPNSLIKPDSSIYKFEITYSNATIAKTFIQVPDTTAFNPFGQ